MTGGADYSFGCFEVDTRSGELYRQGVRINLPGQPFQALMLLLERLGEVVTREELQNRLWPGSTSGDFERGLNKAINKLRVALGDDAEKPRYIETLPQRGYRLVARVDLSQALDDHVPQQMPRIGSLAVLPLQNLSGDPAQEYFSDGMTDELISEVANDPIASGDLENIRNALQDVGQIPARDREGTAR